MVNTLLAVKKLNILATNQFHKSWDTVQIVNKNRMQCDVEVSNFNIIFRIQHR